MATAARPLIALLTDFGTRDPYVAAMKLVIASRADAELIDLGHDIAPHDVFEAAVFLRFALASLEGGRRTIVVSVVDPGVGSGRRIVAASRGARVLLAPDNGSLGLVIDAGWEIRSAENEALFLHGPSSTFHGRDRFAPLAAALAAGLPLDRVGPRLALVDLVALPYDPPRVGVRDVEGSVIAVDRFGNAITDVEVELLGNPREWRARAGGREIATHAATYAEREGSDEPFLIVGSRGTMEISLARGSAADLLQLCRLDPVVFHRGTA
ncbi:MAG: SAM hydrolase/SAM-dependent halogenase family protein [Thermoanaerobaculia bacterium]